MSSALVRGLRSPIRRVLNACQHSKEISTSLIHNDTIIVKNNDDFVEKVIFFLLNIVESFCATFFIYFFR